LTSKPQDRIFWHVHPMKDESLLKSIILCSFICFICVFSYYYLGFFYSLTAFFILIISLNKYFFKTSYLLDHEVIRVKTLLMTHTQRWDHFKRFGLSDNHLYLSPLRQPSRLDQFQALSLLLPAKLDRQEIEAFVKLKLGKTND